MRLAQDANGDRGQHQEGNRPGGYQHDRPGGPRRMRAEDGAGLCDGGPDPVGEQRES
jgi:hypothetical protein